MSFLAATAFVATPAVANPNSHQAVPASALKADTEDPTVQSDAAHWYANYHNVSLDTAYQRLQIQDAAQSVIGQVQSVLGSQWAGSWFDANDQGRLKIGVATTQNPPTGASITDAQAILATTGVDQYTDFVSEQSSMSDLEAAQKSIDAQLASQESAGSARTVISPSANAVVIKTSNTATSSDMTEVNSIKSAAHVQVEKTDHSQTFTTASCIITQSPVTYTALFCDPPLRGGPLIAANGGSVVNYCTAGFVVKSVSDSKPYLLTAGHCLAEESTSEWDTRESDNQVYKIGESHSYTFDDSGDYGLISIDQPGSGHWDIGSTSYVWVGSSSGGGTTQNSFYPITNHGYSSQGMTVCATSGIGMSTGFNTDCGEVLSLGASDGYTSHLADTNVCGTQGSSGGPFYKNNIGYGILTAVSTNPNVCESLYQGLVGAEQGSNVGLL